MLPLKGEVALCIHITTDMSSRQKPTSRKTLVNQIDQFKPLEIRAYSSSVLSLWFSESIPGPNIPKAYALLRYTALPATEHYRSLMKAILTYYVMYLNRRGTPYSLIADAKKQQAHDDLEAALAPILTPFHEWILLIPNEDRWKAAIQERFLHLCPRDPEGSIDLRGFAADSESVHRSSVQGMIAASLRIVFQYPVDPGVDAFSEFLCAFVDQGFVQRDLVYALGSNLESLTIPLQERTVTYKEVFAHVWAYIRSSEHKQELVKRLVEELEDGLGTCPNGQLARLLNVLQGYELSLPSITDKGSLLQNRMALIAERPLEERLQEATRVFEELGVPKDEQGVWMESLVGSD